MDRRDRAAVLDPGSASRPAVHRRSDRPAGANDTGRGHGARDAAFVMEGLVDRFAEAVRRDPAEIRRQNFVPPDAFPYRSASGCTYDKMDYREILDRALAPADYAGLRRSSAEEGPEERSGVGIACSMLMGGFGPSRAAVEAGMDFGGYETVQVRMDRGW